jgi:hypothetical protein
VKNTVTMKVVMLAVGFLATPPADHPSLVALQSGINTSLRAALSFGTLGGISWAADVATPLASAAVWDVEPVTAVDLALGADEHPVTVTVAKAASPPRSSLDRHIHTPPPSPAGRASRR